MNPRPFQVGDRVWIVTGPHAAPRLLGPVSIDRLHANGNLLVEKLQFRPDGRAAAAPHFISDGTPELLLGGSPQLAETRFRMRVARLKHAVATMIPEAARSCTHLNDPDYLPGIEAAASLLLARLRAPEGWPDRSRVAP